MALVEEFGYAVYGAPDLGLAVDFFRNVCQLEVSERRDDTVFLTGDTKHAWVRLQSASAPELVRLGFKVTDAAALDEVKSRLADEGILWAEGGTVKDDRIANSLRFRAPMNFEIELYEEQVVLGASPASDRGLLRALHTVVFVEDVVEGRDFFTRVLGFQRSDQIEDLVVFLRCGNGYHHSIGLAKGAAGQLDHICFLADELDTVVRFRNHARAHHVKTEDLVKHTASGSVSVYLDQPGLGIGIEICHGHEVIKDENYRGRLLKAGPATADRWSLAFPDATPTGMVFSRGGGTSAGSMASES